MSVWLAVCTNISVLQCVPTGGMHSVFLPAGPGAMELQQPHLSGYWIPNPKTRHSCFPFFFFFIVTSIVTCLITKLKILSDKGKTWMNSEAADDLDCTLCSVLFCVSPATMIQTEI